MPGLRSEKIAREIVESYNKATRLSKQRHENAKAHLPGGDTRSGTYYAPYPVYMERGEGCYLYDCDGNRYVDFHCNYTSLIHGHGHGPTMEAVRQQLEKGTVFGAPALATARHAEILCARVASVEMVRYCNSGTEATLFALRAARAYAKKDLLVKMDGGYHGSHDVVSVNVVPDLGTSGVPRARLDGPGLPTSILEQVLVVPFNDLDFLKDVLEQRGGDIAAVILEPMLGGAGQIPPQPGYLEGVRELAHRHGALLVFDEVVTFRLGLGGLQSMEGISPDITALGKLIGGGFPVGAFGGRADIMSMFDPAGPGAIAHSGTYNGNDITLAAGIATLSSYEQGAIDKVNRLGERLREGFRQAFEGVGVRGQVTGLGSLTNVHWSDCLIENAADAAAAVRVAGSVPMLVHLEMMNRGIFAPRRGMYTISTAMSDEHVDQATSAFRATLELLRPYMVEEAPHMLA